MISARNFLVRGLLAGVVAGLVAFGVAYLVGEPSVNASIAIEESGGADHDHAVDDHAGDDHAAEASTTSDTPAATEVPRSLQSTAGLLTATLVAGVTLGGLAGVISALALGRLGGLGVRGVSLSVASMGFVSLYLLPYLAYPPNPPAVGHPDTIGMRSALYFIMVAISIIAALTAVLVGRKLANRWGGWYAMLAAIAGYLVVTVTAIALLPTYNEVPADFPATVLYQFRVASLITQLALWGSIGLILGELVHRLQRRSGLEVIEPEYAEQSL
jgi:predicted cobalt transporter CbtA